MTKWFKKKLFHFQIPNSIKESTTLKYLKNFFHSSFVWRYDSQSVARGVAAGLAGAVIPGFQFFYAALLAILFRGNLAIALVLTFITNPFTVLPIIYLTYLIGTFVLGSNEPHYELRNFKWEFTHYHDFTIDNMSTWMLQFGKSFLVGMTILSIVLAVVGYFGTLLIWKATEYLLKMKKKK